MKSAGNILNECVKCETNYWIASATSCLFDVKQRCKNNGKQKKKNYGRHLIEFMRLKCVIRGKASCDIHLDFAKTTHIADR